MIQRNYKLTKMAWVLWTTFLIFIKIICSLTGLSWVQPIISIKKKKRSNKYIATENLLGT